MGIADNTNRSSTRWAPLDSTLLCHPSKRHYTLSITACRSLFQMWLLVRGPRYCIGKFPIGLPKALEHSASSSSVRLNGTSMDLAQLTWRPEQSANNSMRVERFLASSADPSIKNVVSSAYWGNGMSLVSNTLSAVHSERFALYRWLRSPLPTQREGELEGTPNGRLVEVVSIRPQSSHFLTPREYGRWCSALPINGGSPISTSMPIGTSSWSYHMLWQNWLST